ncbi:uncharacterized protein LOC136772073 [Amia ocellicauda]|uniref:uncharacterized protein LOC136772073 n=1 Tax=Amia ocellicauda TaxID=2972642 RepID=UPI003463AA5B
MPDSSVLDRTLLYGQDFEVQLPPGTTELEFRPSADTWPNRHFPIQKGIVTPIPPGYLGRVSVRQGCFVLEGVTSADQGQYTVWYQSGGGDLEITHELSVTAHSDSHTLRSGAALSLPLFTAEPVEVLFAAAGEGASVSVCAVERGAASRPGPGYEHRVSVQSGSLTLSSLTAADQGQYTVRDSRTNRTISSVSVSVSEEALRPRPSGSRSHIAALLSVGCVPLAALVCVVWACRRCWHKAPPETSTV